MFCKHKWEVIDKTILESGYEQIREHGHEITKLSGFSNTIFQKKIMVIVACSSCGKIRRFSESNADGSF